MKMKMDSHRKNQGCGPCHNGGRPQVHGLVQAMLLLFLSAEPGYGYDLTKRLNAELPGELVPDAAVVYKILRNLEKESYVTSQLAPGQGGPARKVYSLTSQGREQLQQWYLTIQTRKDALQLFLSKYEQLNPSRKED